jgi:hypothetical protein
MDTTLYHDKSNFISDGNKMEILWTNLTFFKTRGFLAENPKYHSDTDTMSILPGLRSSCQHPGDFA